MHPKLLRVGESHGELGEPGKVWVGGRANPGPNPRVTLSVLVSVSLLCELGDAAPLARLQ